MSTAQYGIVGSMQTLISVMAILLSLGAEKSIFRLYHDYTTAEEQNRFLSTVTWFIYCLALIMIGILFALHGIVGKVYVSIPFYPYYAYSLGVAFCLAFEVAPRVYLQVTKQSKKYFFVSVLQMFLHAVSILYFAVYKQQEAEGMLKGMLFAQAGMLPIYIGIHIRHYCVRPSFQLIPSILRYCLPLLPSAVASWIIVMSSQIFVERNFSTSDVAVYALSLKIVGAITIFASALMTAYKPQFYSLANSARQEFAKRKIYETQNQIIIVLLIVSGLIAVFARDIIEVFFSEDYKDAMFLIPILMLANVLGKISGYTNLAFYQEKKTMQIMWIMIIASIVSVTMNYYIIPRYSIYGAAITYMASIAVFFVLKYILSRPYYFIPYNWTNMILTFICMAIAYAINTFLLPVGIIPLVVKSLLICVILFIMYRKYGSKLLTPNS